MNKFLLITITGLFVITGLASTFPDPPKWKNLKVLPKNISEESLDSIMDSYNYSLGVRCSFCHARQDTGRHLDFASDKKGEKDIARSMIKMTNNINQKYFNFNNEKVVPQTVTCMTCHRKNAMPPIDTMPARKEHH